MYLGGILNGEKNSEKFSAFIKMLSAYFCLRFFIYEIDLVVIMIIIATVILKD